MSNTTGAQYLADALAAFGVTHFFYVPVIVPDALKAMTEHGILPVMTHGEKAAAYMADGYARISKRPGVCGAQAIGGTNLAAGLRDAFLSRNPVIAISGGKSPSGRYRFSYQEIDDMPVYSALTKYNATVDRADRLPDLLNCAFRAATTGMPQPVHLELGMLDGAAAMGPLEAGLNFNPRYGRFPAIRTPAPVEDILKALEVIAASKRPIIVAGGGVRSSGAESELLAFARQLSIPVAVALNAKGAIPDSDSLAIGVVGEYSRPCANTAVMEADLVIYIGSLTGGLVTRNWTVPPLDAKVVHIDINPENIGRNFLRTEVALVGDAKEVLSQLIANSQPAASREKWLSRIDALKAEWIADAQAMEQSNQVPIQPQRLCRDLSDMLPSNAIVVADTGHAGAWLAQNIYCTNASQSFIRAHGSLGWSFPAAIGAACAAPQRPVFCFVGDGGFYYHISELETARRYGIKVIIVVNNNNSLNQEQSLWKEDPRWEKNWKFSKVNFAEVAASFGCEGIRVERPSDIKGALRQALLSDHCVVIDVLTDETACAMASVGPSGTSALYSHPDSKH